MSKWFKSYDTTTVLIITRLQPQSSKTNCSPLEDLKNVIRKAGEVYKWKRLKSIPWVDVRQLTVNIHGPDYKTQASDSSMSSLPNNVLHVSPSATFFPPFLLHFYSLAPFLFILSSPQHFDCGKLMCLSQSLRKPAFLLNWCLGWYMRGNKCLPYQQCSIDAGLVPCGWMFRELRSLQATEWEIFRNTHKC